MPSSGEEFGPCPFCGQLHPEHVLLCPTAEKLLPLQGRILDGKFRFTRLLGEGGMGAVWKAQNILVKKDVALKLMHPQFASDEGVLARFRNEATAAGRIGSDHICDILDLGRSPLGPYIVMELMNGKDFATLLQERGRIDAGLAVLVVREALAGLAAAHAVGIVHRDLKPENIFLHEPKPGRLVVKLMDFGISKFTEGEQAGKTGVGVLMGTPEYMSPEQTEGAAQVDLRTDVWAMGVILYWALAGRNPFVGPTMAATLVNVSTKTQPPLRQVAPHVDPQLVAIVDRCLAKNPDERWQSAEQLAEALAPYENPNNGLYTPMHESVMRTPSRPGATVASAGPPAMRPGAAPTIAGAGMNPATLGGANHGVAASPTWSNEIAGAPITSAPTLGGGGGFGLRDVDLDARPETAMGGGKGVLVIGLLVGVAVIGAGGWFAYQKLAGGGTTVASTDDAKTDDAKTDDAKTDDAKDDGAVAAEGGADDAKAEGGETKTADGGDTKTADGGDTKTDGGDTKADGGDTKSDGGDTKADGGDTKADGGDTKADDGGADADDDGDGGKADDGDDGGKTTGGKTPTKKPKVDEKLARKVGSLYTLARGPAGTPVFFTVAQGKCKELASDKFAGLSDWRLPTAKEMDAIQKGDAFWLKDGSPHRSGEKGKILAQKARYTCVAKK